MEGGNDGGGAGGNDRDTLSGMSLRMHENLTDGGLGAFAPWHNPHGLRS